VFVEEALRLLGQDGTRAAAAIASDRASRSDRLTVSWKPRGTPLYTLDFKGIAHDRYRSTASGRDEVRWLGRPITQKMPVFGVDPDKSVSLPKAWWVPATAPEVIARLKLHGITYETITASRTLTLDTVRIAGPKLGGASEGHVPLTPAGYTHAPRRETYPAGSVRVPADQPLGLLAAVMLEPESADSLLAWNFFPGMLQRTEYIEGYAIAPLADRMLAEDADLRRAFQAKLAADPAFAADGNARLAWFYERTPYFDERYLLYPIGRELR
jgi:hypothetical protein